MIKIDGSYLEGGGALTRTCLALSTITGKPIHLFNIRKSRPNGGGLKEQHLKSLKAISELCNGKVENAQIGAKEIWFQPGQIKAEKLDLKIETAGSITLALQSLIPASLFAPNPVKINFKGGATDTFFSPTIDYFRYVFLKILEKTENIKIETNILKRGYYPEGGARAEIKIHPSKLKKLNLIERGNLKNILIISGASNLLKDKKIAQRQLAGTREVLGKLNLPITEKVEYYQSQCPGSQICLIGEFEKTIIGVDNLGKIGKRAEEVGKEAALNLLKEQRSEACLDKHLADQILPYLALSKEKSSVTVSEITNHCKTNIWLIEKFIKGKFEIKGNLIVWNPF